MARKGDQGGNDEPSTAKVRIATSTAILDEALVKLEASAQQFGREISSTSQAIRRALAESNGRLSALTDLVSALQIQMETVSVAQASLGEALSDKVKGSVETAVRSSAPPMPLKGKVPAVILGALDTAGIDGLSGGEINDLVQEAGYGRDAAEKAKTHVKRGLFAFHDEKRRRWFSNEAARSLGLLE